VTKLCLLIYDGLLRANTRASIIMTSVKPIVLYGHATGPNPWKISIVLEELSMPFELKIVPKNELKQPAYEAINPNGRVPAIQDPNTGITLWESGAIIEYLMETYDKDHKLSFPPGTDDYWRAKQWLYFQVSGQGPYFGQAVWFKMFHPEKVVSAQERYVNEIRRVTDVLNRALDGKEWLVGSKSSFADLSFVMWYNSTVPRITGDAFDMEKEFPNVHSWLQRMRARPSVMKVAKDKAAAAPK